MHHKRRRPKNRRSGCLLCKPQKMNRGKRSGKFLNRSGRVRRLVEHELRHGEA